MELKDVNGRTEDLIEKFNEYMDYFNKNNPFSGPSWHLYRKIMGQRLNSDLESLVDVEFIEWTYATLASWGMHRMGPDDRGAKMNDFDNFKNCILENKSKFIELEELNLNEVELDSELTDKINSLYLGLGPLMKSSSKLVATSKVLHFFLPHLFCPMDRSYTMKFFKKYIPVIKNDKDQKNILKELKIFDDVFKRTNYIARKVNCEDFMDIGFSPTIPKVIDNAIVACVKMNDY